MSAQHTPGPLKSQAQMDASLENIRVIASRVRAVQQRFRELENTPGGRSQLLPVERIEYDSIGALFSDLRAAIAKATGSAA